MGNRIQYNVVPTVCYDHNVVLTVCYGTDWLGWTSSQAPGAGRGRAGDVSKKTEEHRFRF